MFRHAGDAKIPALLHITGEISNIRINTWQTKVNLLLSHQIM